MAKAYCRTYVEPPPASPNAYNDLYGPRWLEKGGAPPACPSCEERPGEEGYFFPIGTVAVPAGETQPAD